MFKSDSFTRRAPPAVWRYGLAIVSVAMALGITLSLEPYTTLRTPFLYAAILITTWFGGIGPGLLAVTLATLALGYYFGPPIRRTLAAEAVDAPFILSFSLLALLITWVSAKRKGVEKGLKQAHDELEAKVRERTSDLQRANEELRIEITERKRAEEALRRSEAYLVEAQRLGHTGSWARNLLCPEASYWSREGYRIFGFDLEQALPSLQTVRERIHPEDAPRVEEMAQRAIRQKIDLKIDYRVILPDGSIKYIQSVGHPVLNAAGDVVEMVGSVMDITEHKQAEEAVRQAQAELAHVTRVMTMGELATSIAHEVNQPLAAVVTNGNACLRWLAGEAPNLDEAREAARRIVRDGKRAGEVIARTRALLKKTGTEKERLDLNEAIREVVALAQGEVRRNRVALHLELAGDLPPVLGDRVQLQQVVLNLIMNGIEAMNAVEDRPRALVLRTQSGEINQVRVTVQDSGIGLDPQSIERIFEAFYTTKRVGMGMGLSISRSIVENHGGRLWAVPHDGPGVTFEFALPVEAAGAT